MENFETKVVEEQGSGGRWRALLLLLLAAIGGFLNGLLGTGGGMILLFGLRRIYRDTPRSAMAISAACVCFFSILSTILYKINGYFSFSDALPHLLPAYFGGLFGAFLLGRLPHTLLDIVLACLLLFAGFSIVRG